jgi:hypothetical protein
MAKPRVLRASKKLCVRGGVLSLMKAAGAAATNAVVAGSVIAGATDEGAAGFTAMAAGAVSEVVGGESGSVTATKALAVDEEDAVEVSFIEDSFVEDAFALEVEAGTAEGGVDAGEGTPRSSLIRAKADDTKNANTMAATATLTSLPLWSERKMCEEKLNAGF